MYKISYPRIHRVFFFFFRDVKCSNFAHIFFCPICHAEKQISTAKLYFFYETNFLSKQCLLCFYFPLYVFLSAYLGLFLIDLSAIHTLVYLSLDFWSRISIVSAKFVKDPHFFVKNCLSLATINNEAKYRSHRHWEKRVAINWAHLKMIGF